MNRVHIKTYGCQMNERDSEAVAAMLRARGYRIVASEDECDVLLLNTCSVRDAAEQKAIGKAGYAPRAQEARPRLRPRHPRLHGAEPRARASSTACPTWT